MYYASIGIIALIIHVIVNFEALRKVDDPRENFVRSRYRLYLLALIAFYIADAIWGFFYAERWVIPTFIDTCMFFFTMVLSVLFWTIAVVAFTGSNSKLGKVLVGCGWFIFAFEIAVLIINIFYPITFAFADNKDYVPLPARYITLFMQMALFFASAIYAFYVAVKSSGVRKYHYMMVGISGIVMTGFIALQMGFPEMPFYSLGCMFGTCIIHSFVYRERTVEHAHEMKMANQKAYRDGLTGVKNKLAYLEALADVETSIENGSLKEYGVVVFDLNGLKMINDTLGHEAGDEYIKSACRLICQQFKHSPVFRIGGDEFVAILKGGDYEQREELEGSFRKTIDDNQQNGAVVVSSGLAIYMPDEDSSYNDVFKRADEEMYARKQALKSAL